MQRDASGCAENLQESLPQASTPASFMPWKPARDAALRVRPIGTKATPAAGIAAASMARRCQTPLKPRKHFSSPANQAAKRQGGRGALRRRTRHVGGHS
jgi:hypothetical protein